jgi:hypothetical protein
VATTAAELISGATELLMMTPLLLPLPRADFLGLASAVL